jgi:superfamily I DNA/RNA helicase
MRDESFTPVNFQLSAEPPPAPATSRVWSAYQQAVLDDVAHGRGHTVVIARAGSGKSTVLEECVRRIPAGKSVAVFAFGKEIADSMRSRIDAAGLDADVATTHSYGFRQLRRAIPKARLEKNKLTDLVRDVAVSARFVTIDPKTLGKVIPLMLGSEDARAWRTALIKGVSLAKGALASTAADVVRIAESCGG